MAALTQRLAHRGAAGGRLPALDAMRGIAAICVVIHHIGLCAGVPIAPHGYVSVDLFFILSGFVISRSYADDFREGLTWQDFLFIRLARVYPMALFGMFLGLAVILGDLNPDVRAGLWVMPEFLFVPVFHGRSLFPLNYPLWSLFFELIVNMLHVTVFRRAGTGTIALTTICCGLALVLAIQSFGSASLGWTPGLSFVSGFARVGYGYFLGVLLFRIMRPSQPAFGQVLFFVALAALPGIALLPMQPVTALDLLGIFIIIPAAAAMAIRSTVPVAFEAIARWLGDISYPVYAIHMPLLFLFAAHISPAWPAWAQIAVWSGSVFFILGAATLLYRGFDQPVRRRIGHARQSVWLALGSV